MLNPNPDKYDALAKIARKRALGLAAALLIALQLPAPTVLAQSSSSPQTGTAEQANSTPGSTPSSKGALLNTKESLDAQRKRGQRLINGWNITPNKEEGVRLLESAIEQGDRESLLVLGRFYMDGQFLKRDRQRALALFERAAKMGDYSGIEALGEDLMWNGRTRDNKREAERLLTMAGESGRGSAWTTLGYGSIYGKLTPAGNARYRTYLQHARVLGDNEIEIVEASRLLYRSGKWGNAPRAIRILEAAAEKGNADAIKYLIRLVRDGNHYNVDRNRAKARALLRRYGPKLPPAEQQQQEFLLRAVGAPPANFSKLSSEAQAIADFSSIDFQKQVFKANTSLSIYLAQEALKKKQLYRGPLNGRATKSTMTSLRAACNALIWKSGCDKKLLSDGSMAMIIRIAVIQ